MNFLEKLKNVLTDEQSGCLNNDDEIQSLDAPKLFMKYNKLVAEFINKWNSDPSNRDQTYIIFQQLTREVSMLLENMGHLEDRDLKLETNLIKAEGLKNDAIVYKTNAKKHKNTMKSRKCCISTWAIIVVIAVAAIVLLILWLTKVIVF